MNGLKKYTALFLLCLISVGLYAQTPLSLDSCVKVALKNRASIKALSQDQLLAALKTADLRAKYWPQVSLNYNYRYNPIIQTSIVPVGQFFQPATDEVRAIRFGTPWQQNAGATVYQPLWDASIASQVAESKIQDRLKQLDRENAENELRYEVVKTYANIWLNQTRITDSALDTLRSFQSVQLMKARLEEGRLLKTEYNKARVNHNHALENYQLAVTEFVKQIVYLSYLTTLPVDQLLRANYQSESLVSLLREADKTELNPQRISAINQLQGQNELVQQQLIGERRKNKPTVGVEGFFGANQFANTFNPVAKDSWYLASYVGLSVKWNLLAGENRANHLQQLGIQATSLSLQAEEQEQLVRKDLLELDETIRTQQQQLIPVEENIVLFKESLQIYQERFNAGKLEANDLNSMEIDLQKEILKQQDTKIQLLQNQLKRLFTSGNLALVIQ
ncbi:outer membrane protein TolC [Larkinella arboricola]|uniref:Outer membrane protein TolC n=1 Tax=Larkinella arboricola TaxID=643671 RepID=A0A327WQ30_LARAB|nr:outer membrane protein TolC [Larkinella arboricola]